MKVGIRTPNIKKRVKANTTAKVKRAVKKSVNPLYGKKGIGLVNNPKKTMYNKLYSKTTVSAESLIRTKNKNVNRNNTSSAYDCRANKGAEYKKHSALLHIILLFFTAGIGNIVYALYIIGYNNNIDLVHETNNNDYEVEYDNNINENDITEKEICNYEVIKYNEKLQSKVIKWNTSCSYTFEKENIDGYDVLKEDRVVGCYYRKENIDEVIEVLNNNKDLKFKLEIEDDFNNVYDSNARKISFIYSVKNEIRKMHIGYLSKETALELKGYDDIKVSLIKIENIDYQDTLLEIYLKTEVVKELKEKIMKEEQEKKRVEEERKLREINWNIAYETNKLATELESMDRIEEAKNKYLEAIKLGFDGSHPYDRLNVIFRREKNYESEIENCRQAIRTFEDLVIVGRGDAEEKLKRYKKRLERAVELNQKQIDKEKGKEQKEKIEKNINKEIISDVENPLRRCTICNVEKYLDEFEKSGKDSKGNIRYKHQCKKCRNELRRNKNASKYILEKDK